MDANSVTDGKNAAKSGGIKKFFRGFTGGAAAISAGALIAKILGAVYRIPLTNLLGAEGLGVYQTVFPVYCILLTFSSTGVPTAIAKLISAGEDEKAVMKTALSLFIPIGAAGSLLMAALSGTAANLQGNPNASLAYICLSPSVAAVSAIACFRGLFQGRANMLPTAVSQTIEQAVKLAVGLTLCSLFARSPTTGGALACAAVTISEGAALAYLAVKSKGAVKNLRVYRKFDLKQLIGAVIPVTLSAVILPAARFFDSFAIMNFLKTYTDRATALYGIYTGGVESVVGVPVAVCYGFATALLPSVSRFLAQGKRDFAADCSAKAAALTLAASTILAFFAVAFAKPFVNLFYRGLSAEDRDITAFLIQASFPSIILLSLMQTTASTLVAIGKPYAPCLFAAVGVALKIIAECILLQIPEINVTGALLSDILCYFVAVFGNLVYIISILNKKDGISEK